MGTGFTIDTPLRVAKYGISSVISLVDDVLIEQMRVYHSRCLGRPCPAIEPKSEDARARRITAWLDLVDELVAAQSVALQAEAFEPGTDITRYFDLLPDSPLRRDYDAMRATVDPARREALQAALRPRAIAGPINANIMTKLDSDQYVGGQKRPAEFSSAMAALRGFATSTLRSSIVFSAGMNPRLYTYAAQFPDFLPDAAGGFRKLIALKVSDYRSALIQGRFLARRGLWVSEFRIESGLNCGGHAFATPGHLMGPILAQFRAERAELVETLHAAYAKALAERGLTPPAAPLPVGITAQGGIGTAEENAFLLDEYDLVTAGWGTPFLLVPEVTNVDETHRVRLAEATGDDVYLSDSSPLGIPFWNLRTSASEAGRRARVVAGHPGSSCPKGYLVSNTEFTEIPICTASKAYQARKLRQAGALAGGAPLSDAAHEKIVVKSCICQDLAGGATLQLGIDPAATPAVCCGPNIVNFDRACSLDTMIDHIYGRAALPLAPGRPHVFLRELALYVDHLGQQVTAAGLLPAAAVAQGLDEYRANLEGGIAYYEGLADRIDSGPFLVGLRAETARYRATCGKPPAGVAAEAPAPPVPPVTGAPHVAGSPPAAVPPTVPAVDPIPAP